MTIDGTTDEALRVRLTQKTTIATGLQLGGSGGSTVKGMAIYGFGTNELLIASDSNVIQGNFIGTQTGGAAPGSTQLAGVTINAGELTNLIGGSFAGAGNTISGNVTGVKDQGNGTIIDGNSIGTNPTGTAAVPNTTGVQLSGSNTKLGELTAGAGNVISGNSSLGVAVLSGTDHIQGNMIGTDKTGTTALRNGSGFNPLGGIQVNDGASDHPFVQGNTIAFNGGNGITVGSGHLSILVNSIHDNSALGIDLGISNVNPNDPQDTDSGPNGLQNYPIIDSATVASGATHYTGEIHSTPSHAFHIIFFSDTQCDPSEFGEGRDAGPEIQNVVTNLSGDATFEVEGGPIADGASVTAIAIDNSTGDSSEFSQCVVATGPGPHNYVVDDDSGAGLHICSATPEDCSLNGAIELANAHPGLDLISFDVPAQGNAIPVISVRGAMPVVSGPVQIDGTTQPQGRVQLTTTDTGFTIGLVIEGGGSTVRGMAIYGFGEAALEIDSDNNTVAGNFLGTPDGLTPSPTQSEEGLIVGGSNNTIGGVHPADINVMSGNSDAGIEETSGGDNLFQGNYIGVDVTGNVALPNGIGLILNGSGSVLDGEDQRNVISGNQNLGIDMRGTDETIDSNVIGQGAGPSILPNGEDGQGGGGIYADAPHSTISHNFIADNNGFGIGVASGVADIVANRIVDNTDLGIDLNVDGVTSNDAGDGDTGPNGLQNHPTLLTAVLQGFSTHVTGTLNSLPNVQFGIDFFENDDCDPSGFGEGLVRLDANTLTTNGSGNVSFSLDLNSGHGFLTATVQGPDGTSEFSNCIPITVRSTATPGGPTTPAPTGTVTPTATATPSGGSPTATPTQTPTATPAGPVEGDANCDGHITTADGLDVLEDADGFGAATCADQADVDCSGDETVTDALDIFRFAGGLGELPVPSGCPAIGSPL